ncbi:MAG: hypothetical protein ACNS62_14340 [Candidatus Cyclobacteriaceae bacterium M3_2C_046]
MEKGFEAIKGVSNDIIMGPKMDLFFYLRAFVMKKKKILYLNGVYS